MTSRWGGEGKGGETGDPDPQQQRLGEKQNVLSLKKKKKVLSLKGPGTNPGGCTERSWRQGAGGRGR